jgi:hypothetical protein
VVTVTVVPNRGEQRVSGSADGVSADMFDSFDNIDQIEAFDP